jgi:hypothetical protein
MRPKVFCVGCNKTGTTSMRTALAELGYKVGSQRTAEELIRAYRDRDFGPIIDYCRTAEAFQDVPFSWPHTYVVMDQVFPQSKFILTVRDPDEWYRSYIRHQKKVVGTSRIPDPDDLRNHPYVWNGWLYDANICRGFDEHEFYCERTLISEFKAHNRLVMNYFKFKDNLLVIDVSEKDAYQKLCRFLGHVPVRGSMPWKNRTQHVGAPEPW